MKEYPNTRPIPYTDRWEEVDKFRPICDCGPYAALGDSEFVTLLDGKIYAGHMLTDELEKRFLGMPINEQTIGLMKAFVDGFHTGMRNKDGYDRWYE